MDDGERIVKRIIDECFPGSTVSSITMIERGIELTGVVSLDGVRNVVVKSHYTDVYTSNAGFMAGPALMDTVGSETDVPVPKVFYMDSSQLERPCYIMEYIEGDHFTVGDTPLAVHAELLTEAGYYIGRLHMIDPSVSGFGWLRYRDGKFEFDVSFESFESFLIHFVTEKFSSMRSGGCSSRVDVSAGEYCFSDIQRDYEDEILGYIRQVEMADTGVYCHWDYKYGNILCDVSQGQITGVIDWENPLVTDPLLNFASVEAKLVNQFGKQDGLSNSDKKLLQYALRRGYINGCDSVIDFSSRGVRRRLSLYHIYHLIHCMDMFYDWFHDRSESERQEAEEMYRGRFQKHLAELRNL